MSKDKDYIKLIHTTRWVNLRIRVLSEVPSCERCLMEGYLTAASEIHHRRPVETATTFREKERLMFDRSNLMSLCHACHVKTHIEMGKGSKEEKKVRREKELKRFHDFYFGKDGDPGGGMDKKESETMTPGGVF